MKLIIFDFDGVLVDSLDFLKKVYSRIADILHLTISMEDEHFRELIELDWRETYKKLDIIDKDKYNLSEFTYHSYAAKYRNLIKPYPYIKEVLEKLSIDYKLAVVSNSYKKDIIPILEKNKMNYFSAFFTVEDGELKPSPNLINKCLKHFNCEPKDAVFIGDMDGDIIAGKAAGVKTIAVTYGFHMKHRLKDADVIVNTPNELLKVLGE